MDEHGLPLFFESKKIHIAGLIVASYSAVCPCVQRFACCVAFHFTRFWGVLLRLQLRRRLRHHYHHALDLGRQATTMARLNPNQPN